MLRVKNYYNQPIFHKAIKKIKVARFSMDHSVCVTINTLLLATPCGQTITPNVTDVPRRLPGREKCDQPSGF